MAEPALTAIVKTVRDTDTLRECLRRLADQARPLAAEVLLVVNRPEDELSAESREALSAIVDRLIYEVEPGMAHAVNAGVKASRGAILALTDDDATPDPGWLDAVTRPLREGDVYDGASGPVLPVFPEGGAPAWYRRLLGSGNSHFLGPWHYLGHKPVEYRADTLGSPLPFGVNWAFRREVLLANPLRPELGANRVTKFHGGIDTEVTQRIARAGHRMLYVPEARVYHPVIPERLTLEYVRGRYRNHGRATAILREFLGDPPADVEHLKRKVKAKRVGPIRRLLLGKGRAVRRELRGELYAGELMETERP